jgi:hypothetical protein
MYASWRRIFCIGHVSPILRTGVLSDRQTVDSGFFAPILRVLTATDNLQMFLLLLYSQQHASYFVCIYVLVKLFHIQRVFVFIIYHVTSHKCHLFSYNDSSCIAMVILTSLTLIL